MAFFAGLLAACGKKDNALATPTGSFEDEANNLAKEFSLPGTPPNVTWPENEFTEQLPKPKFETTHGFPGETEFSVFCVATVDQQKDYVKDLKKAGFTIDDSTIDENNVYKYVASNKKGYTVEMNCPNPLSGIATLMIKKPG